MIPKTRNIPAPTTTVKQVDIKERNCLVTVNNMDSATDLYVTFEGESAGIWQRIPANSLAEFMGDFDFLHYKLATGATWGGTDKAHLIIEKVGEAD